MRCIVLVALSGLLSLSAFAQRGQPFAERGDVAFVAQVSGLEVLRLSPALGGVGVRYRIADQRVIGATVGLSAFDRDETGSESRSDNGFAVDVNLWNENHFGRTGSRISPFFGVGLGAGRSVVTRELAFDVFREEQRSTTFRGAALVGAEVRVVSGLTLGAAYTLAVEHQTHAVESIPSGTGQPVPVPNFVRETTTFGVRTGLTDLYLSVYF